MDRSTIDGGSILAGRGRLSFQYGRAWIDKYEVAARHRLLPRRMGQCRRESEDVAASLEIAAFRTIEQRRHADRRQPVPIEQSAEAGIYLALAAAVGIALGGWLTMRAEGT